MNALILLSGGAGVCAGVASGWVTRRALKKHLGASNDKFFTVWGAALLCRLLLTLLVFVILYLAGWPHPVVFILAFILAQTAMQVVPLKPD